MDLNITTKEKTNVSLTLTDSGGQKLALALVTHSWYTTRKKAKKATAC